MLPIEKNNRSKVKKTTNLLFYFIIPIIVSACHTKQPEAAEVPPKVNINAPAFLDTTIQQGFLEIKASGLAITNSNNQRVIRLAKMMLDDETQNDSLFMQQQVDRKITPLDTTINTANQQTINDLSKQSGAVFDKAYITLMVAVHQTATRTFMQAANSTDDALSKLAASTLPEIQTHLDSAQAVLTSLK